MSEKKSIGQVDLLHGPILKNLIIFMIPIFVSNAFQQFYNAVDTALVGNVLGENSLAAIGATASIFELLVGFSMSLGTGFSIVIARAYGSGDHERMKKAIAGYIIIGFSTIIFLTFLSYIGLGPLLHLMPRTPPTAATVRRKVRYGRRVRPPPLRRPSHDQAGRSRRAAARERPRSPGRPRQADCKSSCKCPASAN